MRATNAWWIFGTACLVAWVLPASAATPTVPGTTLPVAGQTLCCNTTPGKWYKPPEVPKTLMRPEVCLALTVGVPAPWGTSEAQACASDPTPPKEPGPPPPSPVIITTTLDKGITTAWVIDCAGKKFDIMKIPESAWTDAKVDQFGRLVGAFEKLNGIGFTYEYEMEPDPTRQGQTRPKRDAHGKKIVKRLSSRSTGPADGSPNGGKTLCDFLRGL